MEEFVQSSGDDGIVVFSLGSLVDKMPKETSNKIASALAQIPQKESDYSYIFSILISWTNKHCFLMWLEWVKTSI